MDGGGGGGGGGGGLRSIDLRGFAAGKKEKLQGESRLVCQL